MKRLIIDLDDTVCRTVGGDYKNATPVSSVIEQIRNYKRDGFEIVINTSRNMRTFEGNVGKIAVHTLPIVIDWLNRHEVPYDEVYVGKPWCGFEGFYVDDRAIRPSEFSKYSIDEIYELLRQEK
ncbi:capsular biosynthesis protein [Massilia sp. LXY-6]|uniref:capsular biosynthesis protein n=1 Tax=Massilia sp. LXY-6 TaxID=3379823 RepID=UPI003EDFDEF8